MNSKPVVHTKLDLNHVRTQYKFFNMKNNNTISISLQYNRLPSGKLLSNFFRSSGERLVVSVASHGLVRLALVFLKRRGLSAAGGASQQRVAGVDWGDLCWAMDVSDGSIS